LDFRTYSFAHIADADNPTAQDVDQHIRWDYNGVPVVDRDYYAYVRGLAIWFLQWLSCHYEVSWVGGEPMTRAEFLRNFCGGYLLNQACAILNYKKQAEENEVVGVTNCTFSTVERQIEYLFHDEEDQWYGDWKSEKTTFDTRLSLNFHNVNFVVQKIQVVQGMNLLNANMGLLMLQMNLDEPKENTGRSVMICQVQHNLILSVYSAGNHNPREDNRGHKIQKRG
jgi:hypothetical protein